MSPKVNELGDHYQVLKALTGDHTQTQLDLLRCRCPRCDRFGVVFDMHDYYGIIYKVKKFKTYILSWLDGWIYQKLKKGKPPWVYVVTQKLAEALGCCRDTVFRHLKDLCEMGILRKTPYKR
ncbi:hypothetical protein [Synechocystis sp. PCC 7509]|uniref:hypothetical protein n=1 Tax=Synechocystis sp. PCC 7509 TaxID=927677 RepID=UPI0002AD17CB|nr:hypothetical protein [Synechocystis sp. PCC 7509]